MECDAALRNCFLSHYLVTKNSPWIDCEQNGEVMWAQEEQEILKMPKKKQWRPMGFTISLIKCGDTRKWDITAYGFVLLKSLTNPLPSDSEDYRDLETLVHIRNKCSHVKKDEELEVSLLQKSCVDTALRIASRHAPEKVYDIQSLLDQKRHRNWVREDDLEIGDRIGCGGHGEVFRGKLKTSGRRIDVAVKMQPCTTEEENSAFLQELRAVTLASLRCSRSCRMYGVSRKHNKMCLVMRLYERSLADILAQGRLEPDHALSLMIQIFQALAVVFTYYMIKLIPITMIAMASLSR